MTKTNLLLGAAAVAISSFNLANAQTEDDRAPRVFDAITVTAQKVEENSQDVPISISTFTGDALNEVGVSGTDDLGNLIPGLELGRTNGEGSQLIVFLRGSGLNDYNSNNAGPVALYADDVYISSPALTPFQFFDIERLEVLKGPQGTLYGRNTTGGAIKAISNKPTDEFELSARAMIGEFESSELEVAISGPITDNVRARVAAQKSDSDGFGTNLLDGSSTNGYDIFSWRSVVDVDATENFRIRLNVHGATNTSEAASPNFLGIIPPDGADILGYTGTGDAFAGEYEPIDDNDLETIGGYIDAELNLGEITLTSITAYDELDNFNVDHTDAGPNQLLESRFGVDSETFTQELRATGRADKVNWLVGAFYLTEELVQNQTIDVARTLRDIPVEFGGTGGAPDPAGDLTGGLPVVFARYINTQETDTYALFGQFDYALSEQLTVTVGGRFTSEEKTFDGSAFFEEELIPPEFSEVYNVTGLSTEDDAASWKLGLDYQASDDVLLYASASRGFKSGGFNGGFIGLTGVDPAVELEPYDPEFVNAYELGVKSEWFDNLLRVNGAIFLNDTTDLQVFTLVNTGDLPFVQLTNAADAEVFGAELDVTAYPTDGLLLNLSAAYLDSELQDFTGGNGEDFSGNKLAFTPEWSVSGLARYDHDLGDRGSVYAQTSFSYKDDQFFSTDNDPIVGQEAYTVVNARFGYQTPDGRFGFAVFGKNITDETYLTNVFDLSDFGWYQRFFAQPEMWGVEMTVDF
ncbi:MAG: TonB-dependent receptor [Pseudomonadota bacterium]